MSAGNYLVRREPRGALLRDLLLTGLRYCDQFLVALSAMKLTEHGRAVVTALEPFLIECADKEEYPAARLLSGTMAVCTYRLSPESVEVLLSATDRLFEWVEPDLPNDLCLLRGDQPWLVTMASDHEAVLVLEESQLEEMAALARDLRLHRLRDH